MICFFFDCTEPIDIASGRKAAFICRSVKERQMTNGSIMGILKAYLRR